LAKARGVEVADLYTQTNLTTVGVSVELFWNVLETVKDNKEPDELQRGRESYWRTTDRQTARHRDTHWGSPLSEARRNRTCGCA